MASAMDLSPSTFFLCRTSCSSSSLRRLFSISVSSFRRHSNRRLQLFCQATAGTQPQSGLSDSGSKLAARSGQDRLLKVPISNIRNFSIIAHIDHGKSTLADKLLQATGTVQNRDMKEQFLDNMDLERERGITIKLQAARMRYVYEDKQYCLNLIDTPEFKANELHFFLQVVNKIDLPGAEPEQVIREIEEVIGLDCSNAILCSAKEGIGITEILDAIVQRIPPPRDTADNPFRALIFDSYYDPYRGVIVYFRVIDGKVKKGDRILFMASGKVYVQCYSVIISGPRDMLAWNTQLMG
ncbi:hypothetical protein DY000_02000394 [Brassica cretica]|uniref:Tr-type G domain-containing protein n=1 Tax=Brassica cretica TaxID=69181 RepID=A0ABQ7CD90_BRACR|nr:hypothetical protein DY000_02000394 [Brassica cretica]